MRSCDYCGIALEVNTGRGRPARFCSPLCRQQWHREPLRRRSSTFALRRSRYDRRKATERERGASFEVAHSRAMDAWPWPDHGQPWSVYLELIGWYSREDVA